jgi:PKD repeat protein
MSHRDQPTLERPAITYIGRSIYTTFGLEGVNNGIVGSTTREQLLNAFVIWAMDEPAVTICDATPPNSSNLTMFRATLTSPVVGTTGVSYRWDFGDGTPFTQAFTSRTVSHTYNVVLDASVSVRVEAVDSWGNHAISVTQLPVQSCDANNVYLPGFFH